ncbi:shugoshin 2 [Athene cunicularia]|uniref:shugoshin 2 n=1 Tax=Athene cunicularia TaxID=194338 RepID=UPI000EF6E15F|nr:shugoshin 2 [Athene cunicularia]
MRGLILSLFPAMASWEASETSFFSLSGVRERMREKKKGVLRTAKLNASIASKIKTKIINNSSTIKVSLKHNNKALALALNAEKANAQRLTQEKTILQKEVEQCHFQNAVLRHKLSFLNNTLQELENLMAAVKMAQLSEFHTSSASLSNGQKSSVTEDSWADDIADGQLMRAGGMPMRVPISKVCDAGQQGSHSTAVQTSLLGLQRPASNEPLEIVPIASKDALQPQPAEKSQSHWEENGKKPTEAMQTQETFLDFCIFRETTCATQQNPNALSAVAWESQPLSKESNEMAKHLFDRLSQGHITQRRKRSTLFATSTPSSAVDVFPGVSSTQADQWSITKDSSSSRKSNTQLQLKSPSSLVSPTQITVIPDRKSLGKEIFCDQPQAKETGCGVETDPSYSQVPEFVPVKVKSKGNRKTGKKTSVKKASTGKKKTNAIKNNAESSPDIPQGEESAQNVKKLLQPKVTTRSSESEVSEKRQKACMGSFNGKNRHCDGEQHSYSCGEVQDRRRTYVVESPQLQGLGRGDLLQQAKAEAILEIQSMESLLKSPVHTFSSHEVPSNDSSLQNSLFLRKETSSACALQENSSMSSKSTRQKINRKTRVIRQRDNSEEENLPNGVKILEAKAEKQPQRSQTSRKMTVRKNSCSDQRNEVDAFGPCVDARAIAKESTKDSPGNLKSSRKSYIVGPLDLAGNLGCVQTDLEGSEIVTPRSLPGSKASKIPRVQRMVAAQSNKNQTGSLQEKRQSKVDNNMNTSEKEAYPKPKPQRKRNTSRPPETDSLARQSDGAKVLIGNPAELASKQTVLMRKSSCITDLLSEPDAFLEKQIAEIPLTNNLRDLSCSLESSPVTCSTASPVRSRLTHVPVSKSLTTVDNRTPEKSSVWLESSLIFKEKSAEGVPGESNLVESSSQNSPSQEPEIRPLQDLTNARTVASSSLEEVTGYLPRRRRDPACYAEPKLNRKLRRGDPFTNTEFLRSPLYKTKKKKTAQAKETTNKFEEEKEWLPEGCPRAKAGELVTMRRDMEPELNSG